MDKRPSNCRNRLRDEGKQYPRSGCSSCQTGGMTGCPYERDVPPGAAGSQTPAGSPDADRIKVLEVECERLREVIRQMVSRGNAGLSR